MQPSALHPVPAVTTPTDVAPPAQPDTRRKLREELRGEEWAMHRELMKAASAMLDTFQEHPHKTTIQDLARIIDLASQLGRRATELDSDLEDAGEHSESLIIEFRAAVKRVYARRQAEGKPLPEGVILDAELVPTPAAPLVPS